MQVYHSLGYLKKPSMGLTIKDKCNEFSIFVDCTVCCCFRHTHCWWSRAVPLSTKVICLPPCSGICFPVLWSWRTLNINRLISMINYIWRSTRQVNRHSHSSSPWHQSADDNNSRLDTPCLLCKIISRDDSLSDKESREIRGTRLPNCSKSAWLPSHLALLVIV